MTRVRDRLLERMERMAVRLDERGGLGGGGSGGGLPSGGSVGQTLLNTGLGTGSWQDIINALVAGSNIAITGSGHQASIATSFVSGVFSDFQAAEVATSETTASLAFTDLTTAGPAVTTIVTATGKVLVVWSCYLSNNTASDGAAMGYALSGANTIAASANENIFWNPAQAGLQMPGTRFQLLSGLTPGLTTFTAKYEAFTGGTASFNQRWIAVFPLAASATILPVTTGLVPIAKTTAYTAVAGDWVLADTTGGTFAVTMPAGPADKTMVAVTWKAGAVAPTLSGNGNTILGGPTFGAVGNTVWLQFSTVGAAWLVA